MFTVLSTLAGYSYLQFAGSRLQRFSPPRATFPTLNARWPFLSVVRRLTTTTLASLRLQLPSLTYISLLCPCSNPITFLYLVPFT